MIEAALKWALVHTDYVQVLLVVGCLTSLFLLYRLQKSKDTPFDIADFLLGPDGKASQMKLAQLGAFLISSWGFVYLTVHNQLTEWFYSSYLAIWSGSHLVNKWLDTRGSKDANVEQQPPVSGGGVQ